MPKAKREAMFVTNPLIKADFPDVKCRIVVPGAKYGFEGMKNYWMRWNCITAPLNREKPHKHEFDEVFHFFGADSHDVSDFRAEVELWVEGKMHLITETTVVYMPAGVLHCPLNFRRVDKPVIFMNVAYTTEYVKELAKE